MVAPDLVNYIWSHRTRTPKPPPGAINIDRKTKFGNPFVVGIHGDHNLCCDKHAEWLDKGTSFGNPAATEERRQWVLNSVKYLRGLNVVCWCRSPTDVHPLRCHGEKLVTLANQ